MEWDEVSESERPSYLLMRAKELARSYGGDVRQAAEALCAVWGWNPKKYPITNGNGEKVVDGNE